MDEREKVLEGIKNLVADGTLEFLEGWDPEALIICSRAEGFDEARDRRIWLSNENLSAPRDVRCAECGEFLVMSNYVYRSYHAAGRKNVVLCADCAIGVALAEKERTVDEK